ncbi:hypothetical protein UlMin_010378 [Ulmus minor]
MGHKGLTLKRGSSATTTMFLTSGAINSRAHALPRDRQIKKTFNNVKTTLLCGLIIILILCDTIGLRNLTSFGVDTDAQKIADKTNLIFIKIQSDFDLMDTNELPESKINPNDRRAWLEKNPQFPNYVNGKVQVLLLTGSPPKPYDNPIGDHYLLKSITNKIDCCRVHGIKIVYNIYHLEKELVGYWAKLPMIRRLMLSYSEVQWIWWMDSDALFTNMVFMLRNYQWYLDLLDAWALILIENLKGRPAFEADDQSALIYLLISKQKEWMDKVFMENSYFLHGYWEGLVDRCEEMMEKNHPGLGNEKYFLILLFFLLNMWPPFVVSCDPFNGVEDIEMDGVPYP